MKEGDPLAYGIKVEVWGDYALFTRPEMKVERVSYDVITPSAARGLLEAIYWKPAIRWIIDRIHVCNPIEFTNIRRNEVKSKVLTSSVRSVMNGAQEALFINTAQDIQQRASLVLKNVRYVIEAHFDLTTQTGETDTPEKHYNIVLRRLRNGQCFHQPCLGCREFPAHFQLFEQETVPSTHTGKTDLGFMLFDMEFSDPEAITPMFFRAVMQDGMIDLTDCGVVR